MQQRRYSARERGSMALMGAVALTGSTMAFIGLMELGHMAVQRQETNQAADAIALGNAWHLLMNPQPSNGIAGEQVDLLLRGNVSAARSLPGIVHQGRGRPWGLPGRFAEVELEGGLAGFFGGSNLQNRFPFRSTAYAEIDQRIFNNVIDIPLSLVLVIDYSPSLRAAVELDPANALNGRQAIQTIRSSVKRLMDQAARNELRFGAVLYADTILAQVELDEGNAAISAAVDTPTPTLADGNLEQAIKAAAHMLKGADDSRFILVISDGAPQDPGTEQEAMDAAESAVNLAKLPPPASPDPNNPQGVAADFLVAFIKRAGRAPIHETFMRNIAGPATDPRLNELEINQIKERSFIAVETDQALTTAITSMQADIRCQVPVRVPNGEPAFVFVKIGNNEQEVRLIPTTDSGELKLRNPPVIGQLVPNACDFPSLSPDTGQNKFFYDVGQQRVELPMTVCSCVKSAPGTEIRVRYGTPRLLSFERADAQFRQFGNQSPPDVQVAAAN